MQLAAGLVVAVVSLLRPKIMESEASRSKTEAIKITAGLRKAVSLQPKVSHPAWIRTMEICKSAPGTWSSL